MKIVFLQLEEQKRANEITGSFFDTDANEVLLIGKDYVTTAYKDQLELNSVQIIKGEYIDITINKRGFMVEGGRIVPFTKISYRGYSIMAEGGEIHVFGEGRQRLARVDNIPEAKKFIDSYVSRMTETQKPLDKPFVFLGYTFLQKGELIEIWNLLKEPNELIGKVKTLEDAKKFITDLIRQKREASEERERERVKAIREKEAKLSMPLEKAIEGRATAIKRSASFHTDASLTYDTNVIKAMFDALSFVGSSFVGSNGAMTWDHANLSAIGFDNTHVLGAMIVLNEGTCFEFKGPEQAIVFELNFNAVHSLLRNIKGTPKSGRLPTGTRGELIAPDLKFAIDAKNHKARFEPRKVAGEQIRTLLTMPMSDTGKVSEMGREATFFNSWRTKLISDSQVVLLFKTNDLVETMSDTKVFQVAPVKRGGKKLPRRYKENRVKIEYEDVYLVEYAPDSKTLLIYNYESEESKYDELRMELKPSDITKETARKPVGALFDAHLFVSIFKNLVFHVIDNERIKNERITIQDVIIYMSREQAILIELMDDKGVSIASYVLAPFVPSH